LTLGGAYVMLGDISDPAVFMRGSYRRGGGVVPMPPRYKKSKLP